MRIINLKQFLRILKGEDLEFRISPFPFKVERDVVLHNAHLPYDLNFVNCDLSSLTFKDCRFSGDLLFDNTRLDSLHFLGCRLQNIKIEGAQVHELVIDKSQELRQFTIQSSCVDSISVLNNPVYETIHLGCENSVRNFKMLKNGIPAENSFSTKVYICPERFEFISIEDATTDLLHIGTFGEYAKMVIKNVNAEVVLIDHCSPERSHVEFDNIKPLDKASSAFHLVNTVFDHTLYGKSAFGNYKMTRVHHHEVDASELIS